MFKIDAESESARQPRKVKGLWFAKLSINIFHHGNYVLCRIETFKIHSYREFVRNSELNEYKISYSKN